MRLPPRHQRRQGRQPPDRHELAAARAIVATAERHAEGRPVAVVRVRIGRLGQLVPEYMSLYFEVAAMDSLCKGASFGWERVPSVLRCSDCGGGVESGAAASSRRRRAGPPVPLSGVRGPPTRGGQRR
ncbi:MAG: hydrogenase maturation nickel metallochaperone HypA [Solirubrobacterales bacterium]